MYVHFYDSTSIFFPHCIDFCFNSLQWYIFQEFFTDIQSATLEIFLLNVSSSVPMFSFLTHEYKAQMYLLLKTFFFKGDSQQGHSEKVSTIIWHAVSTTLELMTLQFHLRSFGLELIAN